MPVGSQTTQDLCRTILHLKEKIKKQETFKKALGWALKEQEKTIEVLESQVKRSKK